MNSSDSLTPSSSRPANEGGAAAPDEPETGHVLEALRKWKTESCAAELFENASVLGQAIRLIERSAPLPPPTQGATSLKHAVELYVTGGIKRELDPWEKDETNDILNTVLPFLAPPVAAHESTQEETVLRHVYEGALEEWRKLELEYKIELAGLRERLDAPPRHRKRRGETPFRGAFPVRAGDCKPEEIVVLRSQFEAVADERDAAKAELAEACDWVENRLAVEGHPIPASMSLLVKWRAKL